MSLSGGGFEAVKLRNALGSIYDARDRNWTLNSATDSVTATATISGSVAVTNANLDSPLSGIKTDTATIAAKDFATQATLALIKAKTDNLDAASSTLATQATLALIKAKTDNLDVALSTVGTQSTLALIKAKTDNLDGALSTVATQATLTTAATSLSNIDADLDVALSTRASEATLATRASETTLSTLSTTASAIQAAVEDIQAQTDKLQFTDNTNILKIQDDQVRQLLEEMRYNQQQVYELQLSQIRGVGRVR